MDLSVELAQKDKTRLVVVKGDVDLYTSPRLRSAIMKAVQLGGGKVAVDLREVRYMDSSGVATLIEGLRACREKKIPFELISPSPPVVKVLQLSRLDSVFTIRHSS